MKADFNMRFCTTLEFLADMARARLARAGLAAMPPRVLAYSVTSRCNCKCVMCGLNSGAAGGLADELKAEDIKRIFTDKKLHHFHLVRFTGGEPFIKDDFIDLANIIAEKTRVKIVYVSTNGYFTDRIVEFVKTIAGNRSCELHLQVSIDATGDRHDKIRNCQGLFERVYKTITALKNLQGRYNFSAGISQVVLKENINQIKAVNNLVNEFGFKHYLSPALWPSETLAADDTCDKSSHGMISEFDNKELKLMLDIMGVIERKRNNSRLAIVNILRNSADRWYLDNFQSNILLPKFTCLSLFIYFRLTADGFVIPCVLNRGLNIGNVKERNFSDIWASKKAQDARREVKKCKGCWLWCDIMPSFYYSGLFIHAYLKRLPFLHG